MIWQVEPAEIVPLVNVMDVAPVSAVRTEDPPQLVRVGGDELLIVTFGGRSSTMEKLVRAVSPGAVMLILNREFSPARIVAGENDLFALTPVPTLYTRTRAEAPNPFVMP